LIHRLDDVALRNPSPAGYDNLGGNSLWPAPEGGTFAFNYLPGSERWTVQDGISKSIPRVFHEGNACAIVEKPITLTNRRAQTIDLNYRRIVRVTGHSDNLSGYDLALMSYQTEDTFEPNGNYSPQDVLLAPWSLEQFPGADGIVAFGKVMKPEDAINCDFYGHPGDRITWRQDCFSFRLGGKPRHQIGLKAKSEPQLIGALDAARSLLFLRKTQRQEGVYFNIADNDQSQGPFSAADMYSIFNGGELGFFELETIGTMREASGRLCASTLPSQTVIIKGKPRELLRYLSEQEGVPINLPFRAGY